MGHFLDKFGLILITATVGLVLTIVGLIANQAAITSMGLVAVGAAVGLPVKPKWSDPVIDEGLKTPPAAPPLDAIEQVVGKEV